MEPNDVNTIIKMQNGNIAAFEKVFEMYKVKAIRTAYLITGNKALAEDIAQEAFIQCYKKIGTLKDPSTFRTWFYKLLTRIAWKSGAKSKAMTPVENIFEVGGFSEKEQAEQYYIQNELSKEILEYIDKLDTKQKTVVLLYYYEGFSITEIARIMNCFEGTVKSRLHTARKNLKKLFDASENFQKEVISNAKFYKV